MSGIAKVIVINFENNISETFFNVLLHIPACSFILPEPFSPASQPSFGSFNPVLFLSPFCMSSSTYFSLFGTIALLTWVAIVLIKNLENTFGIKNIFSE
jgi:hypothetical protein